MHNGVYCDLDECLCKIDANFDVTGEFRRIEVGEWYLNSWGKAERAEFKTFSRFIHLKEKERFFEFDGRKFKVPVGFKFERVGIPGSGDIGKWLGTRPEGGLTRIESDVTKYGFTYFIFRKESK